METRSPISDRGPVAAMMMVTTPPLLHKQDNGDDDVATLVSACQRCLRGINTCQALISDLHIAMAKHVRKGTPSASPLWQQLTR